MDEPRSSDYTEIEEEEEACRQLEKAAKRIGFAFEGPLIKLAATVDEGKGEESKAMEVAPVGVGLSPSKEGCEDDEIQDRIAMNELEIRSQLTKVSIEVERLRKTQSRAPSAAEIIALRQVCTSQLNALRSEVHEEISRSEQEVKLEIRTEAQRLEAGSRDTEASTWEQCIESVQSSLKPLEERIYMSLAEEKQKFTRDINNTLQFVHEDCLRDTENKFEIMKDALDALGAVSQTSSEQVRFGLQSAFDEAQDYAQKRQNEMEASLQDTIARLDRKFDTGAQDQKLVDLQDHLLASVNTVRSECVQCIVSVADQADHFNQKLLNTIQAANMPLTARVSTCEKLLSTGQSDTAALGERVERILETSQHQIQDVRKEFSEAIQAQAHSTSDSMHAALTAESTKLSNRLQAAENEVYQKLPNEISKQNTVITDFEQRALMEITTRVKNCRAETTEKMNQQAEKFASDQDILDKKIADTTTNLTAVDKDLQQSKVFATQESTKLCNLEEKCRGDVHSLETQIEISQKQSSKKCRQLERKLEIRTESMYEELKRSLKTMNEAIQSDNTDKFLRNQALKTAELSTAFEVECQQKANAALCMNQEICTKIASLAQNVAEFIASKADVGAIENRVSGQQPYGDDYVATRRAELHKMFLQFLFEQYETNQNTNSATRIEARSRFVRKVSTALDMALTKFDHVDVQGNSSLVGRPLDSAICLTCERPLLNRRRPPTASTFEYNHVTDQKAQQSLSSEFASRAAETKRPATSIGTVRSQRGPASLSTTTLQSATIYSANCKGDMHRNLPIRAQTASGNRKTIMRSGFRMPQNQLDPDIQRLLLESSSSCNQQEDAPAYIDIPTSPCSLFGGGGTVQTTTVHHNIPSEGSLMSLPTLMSPQQQPPSTT